MWNILTGKSEVSSSKATRRKDSHRSESIVSSSSARKPSRGDDHDRGFKPTSTSSQITHPNTAAPPVASSYATASNDLPEAVILPPDLIRNESITTQMRKARSSREEKEESKDSRKIERRRERSSSRDRHKDRKNRSRSREKEGRKREKKGRGTIRETEGAMDRGLSRPESGYGDSQGRSRAGEISVSSSYHAPVGIQGTTRPSEAMSSHVQDQFPGQSLVGFVAPYRPPRAGAAAEYYGDNGESIAEQPGVRPQPPDLIVGAEPHLHAASVEAAPPPEPSSTGGVGAAASFFNGDDGFPSSTPGKPSKPGKPGRPSKPGKSSSFTETAALGSAALAGGAALSYAVTSTNGRPSNAAHAGNNTMAYHEESAHPSSMAGSVFPSTSSHSGYHASSAPLIPTLGAAAAGTAAGYILSNHSSSHGQRPPSSSVMASENGNYSISALHRPPPIIQASSEASSSSVRPPRPTKQSSHSNNGALYAVGAAGAAGLAAAAYPQSHQSSGQPSFSAQAYQRPLSSMAQRHRHHGPLSTFVEFWKDPYGVAQFEEYSEYIGVCRGCFEPGSSPRDAPRRHHYRRRNSGDRYGSSMRVDKDHRYISSDAESRKRNKKSWLAAGLAGYGIANAAKSLFNESEEDEESRVRYTAKNKSTSSVMGRRSSLDRRSATSYGVTGRSSESVLHGTVKAHSNRRRSRSTSRDRHSKVAGAAAGTGITSSMAASTSRRRSASPKKLVVKESNYSRNPPSVWNSFFGSSSGKRQKSHRKKSKSFFSLSNSSSSSESVLVVSEKSSETRRRTRPSQGDDHRNAEAALFGLTAAATAMGINEHRKGRKGKATADLVAVKESKGKRSSGSERRSSHKRASSFSGTEEEIWESASEEEGYSSVESALAYGGPARRSQESLSSDSSGTGKWGWRWGSRKPKPTSPVKQPTNGFPSSSGIVAAGFAGAATGAALASADRLYGTGMSSTSSLPSMQQVYPIPTSDPSQFDVARHDSITTSNRPLITSRPAPVPLQQPQPVTPVSSSIYTSQAPYSHSYSAPNGPPIFSQSRRQSQPPTGQLPKEAPTTFEHRKIPGSFPGSELSLNNGIEVKTDSGGRRRRDSSPTMRVVEASDSRKPSEPAKVQGETPGAHYDGGKERTGQSRPISPRREMEDDQKRVFSADLKAEKRRQAVSESSLSNNQSNEVAGTLSRHEDSGDQNSVRKRDRRPLPRKEKSDPWDSIVAGTVGAAIGTSAMKDVDTGPERRQDSKLKQKQKSEVRAEDGYAYSQEEKVGDATDVSEVQNGTERKARIAQKAASKIRRSPSHEDYATYFTPPELLSQSNVVNQPTDANGDNDIASFRNPEVITIEPGGSRPSRVEGYRYATVSNNTEPSSKILPWPVPILNIIHPTPEASVAGSTRGDDSPVIRSEDTSKDFSGPTKSATAPKVTWGEDETHEYTVITPLEHHDEFIATPSEPHEDDPDATENWVPDVLPSGHGVSASTDSKTPGHVPGEFADDSEFAATLAAGLEDTGFDPSIVINDPTFRHRDSPPGSDEEHSYRNPVLGALGLGSLTMEGVSAPQGFVEEGELPQTPREEDIKTNKNSNSEKEVRSGNKKRERNEEAERRERENRKGFYDSTSAAPHKATNLKELDRPSAEDDPVGSVPMDTLDTVENLQNIRTSEERSSKYQGQSDESVRPVATHTESSEYFDTPEMITIVPSQKHQAQEASNLDGNAGSGESDMVREEKVLNDTESETSKRNGAVTDMSASSKRADTSPRNNDGNSIDDINLGPDDSGGEGKLYNASDLASSPTGSMAGSGDFSQRKTSNAEDDLENRDIYESPEEESQSIAASAPSVIREDSEGSRKSKKKKSKRKNSLFDDASSSVSAPAAVFDQREPKSKKKIDKKGGFFGLFGAAKTADNVSESSVAKGSAVQATSSSFEEIKKKNKKSKSRRSTDDVYSQVSQPVSDSLRNEDNNEEKPRRKEQKRRSRDRESMDETGRETQDLPAKVYKATLPGQVISLAENQILTTLEKRDYRKDENTHAEGDSEGFMDEEETMSFLGMRPKPPPPPDKVDPFKFQVHDATEMPTTTSPMARKKDVRECPPLSSEIQHGPLVADVHVEEVAPPQASQPSSPTLMHDHRKELSGLSNLEEKKANSPTSSPTAIPLKFRKPPPSPGFARSSSLAGHEFPTPPRRQERPVSTKYRTSTEFQPLWLIEKHSSRQEPQSEEPYPSLPSSHSTSRASSIHDNDENEAFQGHDLDSSGYHNKATTDNQGLRIETNHSLELQDLLDSQQTTPTAATFQTAGMEEEVGAKIFRLDRDHEHTKEYEHLISGGESPLDLTGTHILEEIANSDNDVFSRSPTALSPHHSAADIEAPTPLPANTIVPSPEIRTTEEGLLSQGSVGTNTFLDSASGDVKLETTDHQENFAIKIKSETMSSLENSDLTPKQKNKDPRDFQDNGRQHLIKNESFENTDAFLNERLKTNSPEGHRMEEFLAEDSPTIVSGGSAASEAGAEAFKILKTDKQRHLQERDAQNAVETWLGSPIEKSTVQTNQGQEIEGSVQTDQPTNAQGSSKKAIPSNEASRSISPSAAESSEPSTKHATSTETPGKGDGHGSQGTSQPEDTEMATLAFLREDIASTSKTNKKAKKRRDKIAPSEVIAAPEENCTPPEQSLGCLEPTSTADIAADNIKNLSGITDKALEQPLWEAEPDAELVLSTKKSKNRKKKQDKRKLDSLPKPSITKIYNGDPIQEPSSNIEFEQIATDKESSSTFPSGSKSAVQGMSDGHSHASSAGKDELHLRSDPERTPLPVDDDLDLLEALPKSPTPEPDSMHKQDSFSQATKPEDAAPESYPTEPISSDTRKAYIYSSPQTATLNNDRTGNLRDDLSKKEMSASDGFKMQDFGSVQVPDLEIASRAKSRLEKIVVPNVESRVTRQGRDSEVGPEALPLPFDDDLDLLEALPESPASEAYNLLENISRDNSEFQHQTPAPNISTKSLAKEDISLRNNSGSHPTSQIPIQAPSQTTGDQSRMEDTTISPHKVYNSAQPEESSDLGTRSPDFQNSQFSADGQDLEEDLSFSKSKLQQEDAENHTQPSPEAEPTVGELKTQAVLSELGLSPVPRDKDFGADVHQLPTVDDGTSENNGEIAQGAEANTTTKQTVGELRTQAVLGELGLSPISYDEQANAGPKQNPSYITNLDSNALKGEKKVTFAEEPRKKESEQAPTNISTYGNPGFFPSQLQDISEEPAEIPLFKGSSSTPAGEEEEFGDWALTSKKKKPKKSKRSKAEMQSTRQGGLISVSSANLPIEPSLDQISPISRATSEPRDVHTRRDSDLSLIEPLEGSLIDVSRQDSDVDYKPKSVDACEQNDKIRRTDYEQGSVEGQSNESNPLLLGDNPATDGIPKQDEAPLEGQSNITGKIITSEMEPISESTQETKEKPIEHEGAWGFPSKSKGKKAKKGKKSQRDGSIKASDTTPPPVREEALVSQNKPDKEALDQFLMMSPREDQKSKKKASLRSTDHSLDFAERGNNPDKASEELHNVKELDDSAESSANLPLAGLLDSSARSIAEKKHPISETEPAALVSKLEEGSTSQDVEQLSPLDRGGADTGKGITHAGIPGLPPSELSYSQENMREVHSMRSQEALEVEHPTKILLPDDEAAEFNAAEKLLADGNEPMKQVLGDFERDGNLAATSKNQQIRNEPHPGATPDKEHGSEIPGATGAIKHVAVAPEKFTRDFDDLGADDLTSLSTEQKQSKEDMKDKQQQDELSEHLAGQKAHDDQTAWSSSKEAEDTSHNTHNQHQALVDKEDNEYSDVKDSVIPVATPTVEPTKEFDGPNEDDFVGFTNASKGKQQQFKIPGHATTQNDYNKDQNTSSRPQEADNSSINVQAQHPALSENGAQPDHNRNQHTEVPQSSESTADVLTSIAEPVTIFNEPKEDEFGGFAVKKKGRQIERQQQNIENNQNSGLIKAVEAVGASRPIDASHSDIRPIDGSDEDANSLGVDDFPEVTTNKKGKKVKGEQMLQERALQPIDSEKQSTKIVDSPKDGDRLGADYFPELTIKKKKGKKSKREQRLQKQAVGALKADEELTTPAQDYGHECGEIPPGNIFTDVESSEGKDYFGLTSNARGNTEDEKEQLSEYMSKPRHKGSPSVREENEREGVYLENQAPFNPQPEPILDLGTQEQNPPDYTNLDYQAHYSKDPSCPSDENPHSPHHESLPEPGQKDPTFSIESLQPATRSSFTSSDLTHGEGRISETALETTIGKPTLNAATTDAMRRKNSKKEAKKSKKRGKASQSLGVESGTPPLNYENEEGDLNKIQSAPFGGDQHGDFSYEPQVYHDKQSSLPRLEMESSSRQVGAIPRNRNFDGEEDNNRDSAVQISDSPIISGGTSALRSVRDSGYQDTESSPMLDLDIKRKPIDESGTGDDNVPDDWHTYAHSHEEPSISMDNVEPQNIDEDYAAKVPASALNISSEPEQSEPPNELAEAISILERSRPRTQTVSPDQYEKGSLSPTRRRSISLGLSPGCSDDPRHSIILESPSKYSDDPRLPSPVDSTTKDRSSLLFQSSPSTRDDIKQRETEETEQVPSQSYGEAADQAVMHSSNSSNAKDLLDSESPVHKKPSDEAPIFAERASSLAALSGKTATNQGQHMSLFGGPVSFNSDRGSFVSPPQTPLNYGNTPRVPLNTISEHSPEESSSHKRTHSISDVGSPEYGVKSRRRSRTPGERLERRVRSPGEIKSGEQDLSSSGDAFSHVPWPAVDDERHSVDLERSTSCTADYRPVSRMSNASQNLASDNFKQRETDYRSVSGGSAHSGESIHALIRTPDHVRSASGLSNRSSGTPPLRRIDSRSVSGDLRAANRRSEAKLFAKQAEADPASELASSVASSSKYDPVKDKGKGLVRDMADVYEGYGDVRGSSPLSPTRPSSMRRRQSMQILDLETRLNQLISENRLLQDGKSRAEKNLEELDHDREQHASAMEDALNTRNQYLQQKDNELGEMRRIIDGLQHEVSRLTETNEDLTSARAVPSSDYEQLQAEHANTHQQWQESTRELEDLRQNHAQLSSGMEDVVRQEVSVALESKNAEMRRLQDDLNTAKEHVRTLQQQILASKPRDDFLVERDEDYFDGQCQELCQHVQQWVLRFSKFSDMKPCHLASEIRDEQVTDRLDNAILDGSDVDDYLADRVKRRDVFMSIVMTMIWELVFTRYLFGMDREQRQKLKSLEKTLAEVGPMSAVHKWRATTLTLLSRREAFSAQRQQDTEAVVWEIYRTLAMFLPPPSHLENQIQDSLMKVMSAAIDLSIEMRTQKAEYIMLPPLQPEYDTNGDLARKVYFNAELMNERSGDTLSNDEIEARQAVVRMVLFPLVVKRGDDSGVGDEEIVVCPAQVLVAKAGKDKKTARFVSGERMEVDQEGNRSVQSFAPSSMDMGMGNMI